MCSFRRRRGVPAYRPGEMAERGELTLKEAAARLGVSAMTVLRLIGDGSISARQLCKSAPWAIPEEEIVALDGAIPPATTFANTELGSESAGFSVV